MKISEFFNAVVVSEEVGWRKPSARIFKDSLNKLQIEASEAVYIGDSPNEDIKGAKQAGLKTVFVPSQFNSLKDLLESKQKPDYTAKDLENNFSKPAQNSFLKRDLAKRQRIFFCFLSEAQKSFIHPAHKQRIQLKGE
jgi:beta-phosphoglucomutase-like phosphatase (HAD superfamily)